MAIVAYPQRPAPEGTRNPGSPDRSRDHAGDFHPVAGDRSQILVKRFMLVVAAGHGTDARRRELQSTRHERPSGRTVQALLSGHPVLVRLISSFGDDAALRRQVTSFTPKLPQVAAALRCGPLAYTEALLITLAGDRR